MGLAKARIIDLTNNDTIDVMFNPEEYVLRRDVEYGEERANTVNKTHVQFVRGHRRELTMDLFFDTTSVEESDDSANVMTSTSAIENLMEGKISDSGEFTHPKLSFEWGPFKFQCVLNNIEERFTRFDESGVPKRAILRCTFL